MKDTHIRYKSVNLSRETENELKSLEESLNYDKANFMKYALSTVDHMASEFPHLTLENKRKCKELIFPDGFFVTREKRVYTRSISPFYRVIDAKSGAETPDFTHLVHSARFERATPCSEDKCSNPLSYECM